MFLPTVNTIRFVTRNVYSLLFGRKSTRLIITIIKTTSEFRNVSVTVTVTVGVVKVGVVDTPYGVSQPAADAER